MKRRKPDAQIEREALEGFVAERLDFARAATGTAGSTASSGATASPAARSCLRQAGNEHMFISKLPPTEKRVLAVMRELGLQAKGASGKRKRAKAVGMGGPRVDLVGRAFGVEARNRLRVGGIACIGTGEGRPCLAAVIDSSRRKVVG